MKAIWNGTVIAESNETVVIDGNYYFPPESVDGSYLSSSEVTSVCGWKGTANYHSLMVAGKLNPDAAWYYADPKSAANKIKDHLAFWRGVEVVE